MSMVHSLLRGLYLILDPSACPSRSLVDVLKEAADHGVRLFQYRDKTASMKDAYRAGIELRRASADAGALLIVNDRCDLALAIEADGAHVGQTDLPLREARLLLGTRKLLGISTHTPQQARTALEERPDYIAYGPIFATPTKPDHEAIVGLDGLRHVRRMVSVPLFAIGGIGVSRADEVRAAGADGAAVISAVLQAPNIGQAVEDFMERLGKSDPLVP
jgi:thiamine-phosphate pyrophosphorylase